MVIGCVWEHNGNDSTIFSVDYVGAFARGASKDEAMGKIGNDIQCYMDWLGEPCSSEIRCEIRQECPTDADVRDGDTNCIFEEEMFPLTSMEYLWLKEIAIKSARDFLRMYEAIPDKSFTIDPPRSCFYGQVPRSADEMYIHTKNVNEYYFGEIGVAADNDSDIVMSRRMGFNRLESMPDFLNMEARVGSMGEIWSLRKMLRRFIWHDRIHAKALYRMSVKAFGADLTEDIFHFGEK